MLINSNKEFIMHNKFIQTLFLFLILIASCGIPESEYEKLKTENEKLKEELDECKNGADRLIAKVERSFKENNFIEAKHNIELLYNNHPESQKNKEFADLLKVIDEKITAEEKRREEEEKERVRLANLNNTGIWSVSYYVDDFGEPTKEKYIKNTQLISGYFSNTATQNSDLNVKILITDKSNIDIMLYEYARNNPVKAISSDSYKVLVQEKDGNRLSLWATNYSDRLSLNKSDANKLHTALIKGGTLKFHIIDAETPTTEYEFTIQNADWYNNAYAKLVDKK